jgi:hypothetical protein
MTRTEDRLTDALAAAARRVPDETLRPLIVPQPQGRRSAWLAPVAAAAGVTLVVGLAVAVSRQLPGSGPGSGSPGISGAGTGIRPPRYYVEADITSDKTVVRSTATGAVTATVPVPYVFNGGNPTIAAARNETFFVAAFVRGTSDERIYRFRLTSSGQVIGFSGVRGGVLPAGQQVDAMAASPDGSQLAIGISFFVLNPKDNKSYPPEPSDEIAVIHTATGVKTVWRGGLSGLGASLSVASLSWTGDGRELVYLGQWCRQSIPGSSEMCLSGHRTAEARTLDPLSGGGTLDSGQLLLAQSPRFPYIVQALISPDGSTITAAVLRGPVKTAGQVSDGTPEVVSVEQISLASGQQLRVLYRRDMGRTTSMNAVPDFVALSPDRASQHWMLNLGVGVGVHGWIADGRLVPLQPVNGRIADEAW